MSDDVLAAPTDIAIVGMACRFPGASTVDEYWRNLCAGVESITHFSSDELRAAGVRPADLADPHYVRAAPVLDDIELFDADFFGFAPKEAQICDPQQRLFLEVSWTALEAAGCDPTRFDGAIGVFAGSALSTYLLNNLAPHPDLGRWANQVQVALGNDKDSLATRVAYAAGLTGPSYSVQSYCSSSLVAVSHACTSLLAGECDLALAGGVAVSVPHRVGYHYQPGGIASPDGRCRAFDADAQGTPLGNGVGVVVLRRLADAVADGDHIHAVIRGWAVNNDGDGKAGFTAPGVAGQREVIAEALANANLGPADIDYVEAHGTGTALGDAAELAAMAQVFADITEPGRCAIGSVKTNVGHLDRAAGVAGLIKAALAVEHGLLPPTLHFQRPNPQFDLAASPFRVQTELAEWPRRARPRRAGVSAFGMGGTNAHVVLEQPPTRQAATPSPRPHLLVLSARTPAALSARAADLAERLAGESTVDLTEVAFTLQTGRTQFEHRLAALVRDRADAVAVLRDPVSPRLLHGDQPVPGRPVGLLFAGVGEHHPGLGADLYRVEPVFRRVVDECVGHVESVDPLLAGQVRAALTDPAAPDELTRTALAQPAAFVLEYALAQLLAAWGVRPDAVAGYSVGEYVAATLAGVLNLPDALALLVFRARLIDQLPPAAMVAVSLAADELAGLLGEDLDVAAVNAPELCVVAGPSAAVARLERELDRRGTPWQRLRTSHAFHSRLLEPLAAELTEWTRRHVTPSPPRLPCLSTVTGTWLRPDEATDPGYWARHMCAPVRFADQVGEMLADPARVLVEIGPGRSLGAFVRAHPACARDRMGQIVSTLPGRDEPGGAVAAVHTAVGRLWLSGVDVDWVGYHHPRRPGRVVLPTYPFQRQRYWIDPLRPAEPAAVRRPVADWCHVPSWRPAVEPASAVEVAGPVLVLADESSGLGAELMASLADRGGAIVVPGTGFTESTSDRFTVRPDRPEDFRRLVVRLTESGRRPATVLHLWCLTGADEHPDDPDTVRHHRTRGFNSLTHLVRALAEQEAGGVDITVVADHLHDVDGAPVSPGKAGLLAACLVIPQEYPGFSCRAVDTTGAARHDLARRVVAELGRSDVDAVALRGTDRLVRDYVPAPEPSRPVRWRDNGVYLITGGLGRVGRQVAAHLARTLRRPRLVLTGRRGLPDGEVLAIEGAEVLALAADAADPAAMARVVELTRQHFGEINGVVHAAGVSSAEHFEPIQHLTEARVNAHFTAKTASVLAVARALEPTRPDFHVLFSSVSTVLGGLGFAAYAAANAELDALAAVRARRGERWLSIDWDTWQRTADAIDTAGIGAAMATHEMTVEEGLAAFDRALATPATRVVISTGDLATRLRQWVGGGDRGTPAPVAEAPRPTLDVAYVPATGDCERRLAVLWRETLGIDQIGVNDNFFDLGGNSLTGLQLLNRVSREFGTTVPAVALFQAPTIAALARYLRPDAAEREPDPTEQVLAERRAAARRTSRASAGGIAVIGMAGRFPGASTVDQFWRNLRDGVESIRFFTDQELLDAGVPEELVNAPNYVKARPVLDDIELFDANFFGYSPREALITDPQHRVFLECCWHALEDAGYAAPSWPGLIGVFAGTNISTYLRRLYEAGDLAEGVNDYQIVIGNDKDALTTTVSYKLGLTGPSMAVQTFCSTSLLAVHLAMRSLRDGECDIALAGGVSIRVPDRVGHLYTEGGMESPDGHVRTFDANARGCMFGDGAGVVVLRRLADALADGDTVRAVLRGSAVNNDGSLKVGFSAPSVVGQAEVVAAALADAGVGPETIGYVEAHGTATELGDPIELAALTRAFGDKPARQGCAIGSVKTNVGHLDRAAGVSGLIKTVLALQHRQLPASLHFTAPNPEIDFANSPFHVNTRLREWDAPNGVPRRAGVNSLGMGGTNVHVVVEQAAEPEPTTPGREWQLLTLSARTEAALDELTATLAEHLRDHPELDLADVAHTLQVGRGRFEHRRLIPCVDTEDAVRALTGAAPARVRTTRETRTERPVALLFAGVGEHYVGMTADLYRAEPVFRDTVDECAAVLDPLLGVDLRQAVFGTPDTERSTRDTAGPDLRALLGRGEPTERASAAEELLAGTAVAQPAVFVVEYALARLLASWGVRADALAGYSLGEYVAATLAGVLSLPDALRLVGHRARLIDRLPKGAMLAVSLPADRLRELATGDIDLAAVNAPDAGVLAGPVPAITELAMRLSEQDVAHRLLDTTHAFHSRMLAPVAEQLTEWVRDHVTLSPPRVPCLSNVTGDWLRPEQATDPGYWARHMCATVRFADLVGALLADPDRALVELGAGQSLGAFVRQHPACTPAHAGLVLPTVPARHERSSATEAVHTAYGRLWLVGAAVDWTGYHRGERRRRVPLPTYPFQRERYWMDAPGPAPTRPAAEPSTVDGDPMTVLTSLPRKDISDWCYLPAWRQSTPPQPGPLPDNGTWLVFADASGLADAVCERVAAEGASVVRVRAGSEFGRGAEGEHLVRPNCPEDYLALFDQVRPRHIVHLWSLETSGESEVDLKADLDRCYHSLLWLAKALGTGAAEECDLLVVSAGACNVSGVDRMRPERALLAGPCKVIPLELSHVTCRQVDVCQPDTAAQAKTVADQVLGELSADPAETLVAWRGARRWLPSFDPMPAAGPTSELLRERGVYLITGGLGGIGMAIARGLATTVSARLVLVGRTGLPPRSRWSAATADPATPPELRRRIEAVRDLEAAGAEVLVCVADVADPVALRAAVSSAVDRFGRLDGVVHAAGVPGMGLLQFKNHDNAAVALGPKVIGTRVLLDCLADTAPDFVALFSSITSVTGGGPGQVDYCAANAYLDALAHHAAATGGPRVVSINWGEWQWNAWGDGLSGYEQEAQRFFADNRAAMGISFTEGWQVFLRVLAADQPQVVVSTQDFRVLAALSSAFTVDTVLSLGARTRGRHPRPDLATSYVAPGTDTERRIAALWSAALGITDIGVHDNFFELGGNSLLGVDLVARIRREFGHASLAPHVLYQAPTVSALAGFLTGDTAGEHIDERRQRGALRRQGLRARRQQ